MHCSISVDSWRTKTKQTAVAMQLTKLTSALFLDVDFSFLSFCSAAQNLGR